ncbi:MAG: Ig-like domain repeat protein, partial [Marmoricola sp.]
NAISNGWWGHEGAGKTGTSMFSLDGLGSAVAPPTSATLAAQLAKIGPDATPSNLHVAFVLTSADGSAEKPTITAGETVGQAFQWFDASGVGHSIAGNNQSNDYVDAVSTETSYNGWFNAGQKPYGFDDSLVAHDAADPGDPVSAHPIGTSILNTWPAGTHVSLVYYVSTSNNANNEPIVTRGSDGKAETAWMPFTTVAMPTDHSRDPLGSTFPSSYDTVRTSAGYAVAGGAVAPTVNLKDSWSAGNGTLTASLVDSSNHALTNASGTIQFVARGANVSGGTFNNYGSPVTVSATGTASIPITGLTAGQFQQFEAIYTPDSAASSSYTTATSGLDQAFYHSATSTTVAVSGTLRYGYKQTITGTVTSTGGVPTGTVTFYDKGVSIGSGTLSSTGHASMSKALSLGAHSISVKYAGGTMFSGSSSSAKSVTIAKGSPSITGTLYPVASKIRRGTTPKLTVTVKAYNLKPTGTVTIVVLSPSKHTTTYKVTLRSGVAVHYLPKAVHGTWKVTIKYSGCSTVASGSKAISYYVR